MIQRHPFHVVSPSPWPIAVSLSLYITLVDLVHFIQEDREDHYECLFYTGIHHGMILALIAFITKWFIDIIIESTFEGHHTLAVQKNLKLGFSLFIFSEVMFFSAFFWAYFYFSISPSIEIGGIWPSDDIQVLNPFGIPLLNTIILLSSGITVTWSHHRLVESGKNARIEVIFSLTLTILLGISFTLLQVYEYYNAKFSIATNVYGSIFFLLTGFHGLHVVIGTIFLFVCLLRHIKYHFTSNHHVGFEMAIWYWHFVDVVWLFLYCIIYLSEYL